LITGKQINRYAKRAAKDSGYSLFGVFGRFFILAKDEIMSDETMDIKGASVFLKLSRWSIYQLTRKNSIPCHRPTGKKLIFIKSELETFLRGGKKQIGNYR